MDINQVTANIHITQQQLQQQIRALQQQLAAAHGEAAEKLTGDLLQLQRVEQKLAKSRELALLAHTLKSEQQAPSPTKRALFAIALCTFSGLGLLTLLTIVLLR